jgi:hypothetical protein
MNVVLKYKIFTSVLRGSIMKLVPEGEILYELQKMCIFQASHFRSVDKLSLDFLGFISSKALIFMTSRQNQ